MNDNNVDVEIDALSRIDFSGQIPLNLWALCKTVIKRSLLPEQSYAVDRPSEDSDFASFRKEVTKSLEALCIFIKNYVNSSTNLTFDHDSLVWTLILCGEHSSTELWTTEESRNLTASCVMSLCTLYGCASLSSLLLGLNDKTKSPCFKQAILLLRPKLLQDTWRKHPGAVLTYKWLLTHVQSPHLSEFLDVVSPTALLILDDHDERRRLIGLQCLSHIVDNVSRTEMCQRGLDQVFYRTLEPILWQRKANEIEPAVLCLSKLLSHVERGYTRRVEPGMWDMFDDTLNTLLNRMLFEDQLPLRLAYIKSLGPLLSMAGPSIIRWSKLLLAVFDEYLCKESFDTRKYALEALSHYLKLSTVRLGHNGDFILFLLLRTLFDLSREVQVLGREINTEVSERIKENIAIVGKACPSEFNSQVAELLSMEIRYYGNASSIFSDVLKGVL